ncbi:Ifr2 zinc-binding dehydrogenase [Candida orthopsilosis Co 90-125]|uniref:Ifr2 zinc-binding dehydrogenase n=1 Tax=Candida orthopsilosis (strain 90-125) TaxID=1136231 RepID=H8WVZ7_CANO9|nr:Ifr2 zinc-binding dehydrogenase [Candida orthopsilosis Co 90-125]CCG20621.1 Ifr2 zinc-binding dehydrogenase [Candida orthopsilosis Co 90-125]
MKAAVISGSKDPLFEVKDVPVPEISDHEILIKAKSFAVNPTDWKHVEFQFGKQGDILGSDVSGIVEKVGAKVDNFKVGDYVSSFIVGNVSPKNGAWAEYVAANPLGTVKYPKLVEDPTKTESGPIKTFEGAASTTLGLVTVGYSFAYSLKIPENFIEGDFILVWGGATATGILAIQLAKLIYGLRVVATASPKNHEYLKSLGAEYVFDYNDDQVINKIKEVVGGSLKFGFDTIGSPETFQKTYDATANSEGTIFLDSTLFQDGTNIKLNESRDNYKIHWGHTLAYLAITKTKFFGKDLYQPDDLLKDYEPWWTEVLPKYIDKVKHANLKILSPGLQSAGEALKLSKEGVSNVKVVFDT